MVGPSLPDDNTIQTGERKQEGRGSWDRASRFSTVSVRAATGEGEDQIGNLGTAPH